MHSAVNPWNTLPATAPFVLAADRDAVAAFNQQAKQEHVIDIGLLPEPFLGSPDAPIVLLGLNPGWSCEDSRWYATPEFSRLCRASLAHEAVDFPFYLLNPAISGAPGARWWAAKLGALIKDVNLATVACNVLCVEFFPYHSVRYGHKTPRLSSQEYGFELVRRALARKALVVLMRGRKRWIEAVPQLAEYPLLYQLRSAQNVSISAKNCPGGYPEIRKMLESAFKMSLGLLIVAALLASSCSRPRANSTSTSQAAPSGPTQWTKSGGRDHED